jgi:hypothetical protein
MSLPKPENTSSMSWMMCHKRAAGGDSDQLFMDEQEGQ